MHMGTRVCTCVCVYSMVYVCMYVYVCMCVFYGVCGYVCIRVYGVCALSLVCPCSEPGRMVRTRNTHLCSLFGSREHGLLHIRGLPDSRKVSVGGPPTLFELGDRDPTSTRQIPHSD